MEFDRVILDSNIFVEYVRKRQNNIIEIRDLFIAGIALSHHLPLATFNLKHFQNIPDLDLLEL